MPNKAKTIKRLNKQSKKLAKKAVRQRRIAKAARVTQKTTRGLGLIAKSTVKKTKRIVSKLARLPKQFK